jgi:hypothetical protein
VQALTAFASIAYFHQLSPCSSRWPGSGGVAFALVTRRLYPQRYQLLGRVVLDVRERRRWTPTSCRSSGRAAGRHGV